MEYREFDAKKLWERKKFGELLNSQFTIKLH